MFAHYEKPVPPLILIKLVRLQLLVPLDSWCWSLLKVNCPYCRDSGCIYPTQFSDGQNDCKIGSDKESKICREHDCAWYHEKCPGGPQCIEKARFYDGVMDCNHDQYRKKSQEAYLESKYNSKSYASHSREIRDILNNVWTSRNRSNNGQKKNSFTSG